MENFSLQAKPFFGLGVFDGEVILACAGHLEACIGQGGDHAGAILDQPHGNLVGDPGMEPVAPGGAVRGFRDRLDLGHTLHVHGVGPAVGLVHQVAQAVEGTFITRRGDVEATPAVQLHAWRAEMQLDAILMSVAHPKAGVAVGIEPGEGDLLETVDHLLLLVLGGGVLAGEADDTGTIGPLVRAGVDQVGHALGIAADDLRQRFARHGHGLARRIADQIAVVDIGKHGAGGQVFDRSRTAALAVGEELDQHPGGLRCWAMISANRRSMPTSAAATRRASTSLARPARVAVFSHRAIWLRFPP